LTWTGPPSPAADQLSPDQMCTSGNAALPPDQQSPSGVAPQPPDQTSTSDIAHPSPGSNLSPGTTALPPDHLPLLQ